MKFWAKRWLRWSLTPLAAVAGYALGQIAWAIVEGAIAALSFLPFVGQAIWLKALIQTYWCATWSINFAMRCAPSNQMNVRWTVLIVILIIQLLQLGITLGAPQKQQGLLLLLFCESSCVVGWLLVQTWRAQKSEWRAKHNG